MKLFLEEHKKDSLSDWAEVTRDALKLKSILNLLNVASVAAFVIIFCFVSSDPTREREKMVNKQNNEKVKAK